VIARRTSIVRLVVLSSLTVALSSSCSISSPNVAFSCTDAGRAKTMKIAHEIKDEIVPKGATSADHAHGCDDTPNGVYDVWSVDRDAIESAFNCRHDSSVHENWMLCVAKGGQFALSPDQPTIEVLS
jgi:hypothetical protein